MCTDKLNLAHRQLNKSHTFYFTNMQNTAEDHMGRALTLSYCISVGVNGLTWWLFDLIVDLWPFWESRVFLQDLEGCLEAPEGVGACFLQRVRRYESFCCEASFVCNVFPCFFKQISISCLPRKRVSKCMNATVRISPALRRCGDNSQTVLSFRSVWPFFHFTVTVKNLWFIVVLFALFVKECQKKLEHKLGLDSYLLKPVQRLTKYQLLLKVRLTAESYHTESVAYFMYVTQAVLCCIFHEIGIQTASTVSDKHE